MGVPRATVRDKQRHPEHPVALEPDLDRFRALGPAADADRRHLRAARALAAWGAHGTAVLQLKLHQGDDLWDALSAHRELDARGELATLQRRFCPCRQGARRARGAGPDGVASVRGANPRGADEGLLWGQTSIDTLRPVANSTGMMNLDHLRHAVARDPTPDPLPQARKAAVAAILTRDLELLFMLRATAEGDPWSGHVSFPGGRVEPTDASLLHAAVRETAEEIDLDLRADELIGRLDPLLTRGGPRLVIHPFVFALHRPLPELHLSADEVRSVHRLSVHALLDGTGRGPMEWRWHGSVLTLPRVDFDGVRLWGLTLRIVDDLLDRLDGRGTGLKRVH